MTARTRALTVDEVYALPAMPTALQTFAAVGVSSDTGYDLVKRGDFPVAAIKIGRCIKFRRSDILTFLGLPALRNDESAGGATPAPSVERINEPTGK